MSETFIAEEIHALEQAGVALTIFSLRRPTDGKTHPVHGAIRAPVVYLPEYLHRRPSASCAPGGKCAAAGRIGRRDKSGGGI